jgi:hypothetical protein
MDIFFFGYKAGLNTILPVPDQVARGRNVTVFSGIAVKRTFYPANEYGVCGIVKGDGYGT